HAPGTCDKTRNDEPGLNWRYCARHQIVSKGDNTYQYGPRVSTIGGRSMPSCLTRRFDSAAASFDHEYIRSGSVPILVIGITFFVNSARGSWHPAQSRA